MFEHDFLSDSFKTIEDLKGQKFKISALNEQKKSSSTNHDSSPRREAGLLSTLTQLLSLSSAEEENFQMEQAKVISLARECIVKCQLENLFICSR